MIDTEHIPIERERHLLERFVGHGHRYNFFWLVNLLRRIRTGNGRQSGRADKRDDRIRFRPDTSVVFPATDVKRVEWRGAEGDPVTVVVSFMGLYGFDSALPPFFNHDLAIGKPSAVALRDFLDIFNHRLYSFYYRSWEKYRPQLAVSSDDRNREILRFLAIAGLGRTAGGPAVAGRRARMAAFAGQLGCRVRNAAGLRRLISGFMPDYNVHIEEHIPRWVQIEDRTRLGRSRSMKATRLGATSTIGEKIYDMAGKFRVVLGPLGLRQFQGCLPGGTQANLLEELVSTYVSDHLDYDVELRLISAEVPRVSLGDPDRKLGLSTWLGIPRLETTSRLVRYNLVTAA